MAWVARCFVLGCIFHTVLSDGGYPKESPSKPFQDGGSNDIPGSSGWTAGGSGGGGYSYSPPMTTDYVSRYYGPLAAPVVLPDGTLANTPEVEAARAAHLAALAKAKALWYGKMDDGSYNNYKYGDIKYGVTSGSGAYHQSTGAGPFSGSQDTWQVSKAYGAPPATSGDPWQVSNAYGAPPATGGDPWQLNKPYSGPLASVMVLPSGYLADTPAIAAARAAHLQALLKAQQESQQWKAEDWKQWD